MKKLYLLVIFIILGFSSIYAQTTNKAPKIIRTIPEFGDCDVDTNLTQIQFEFDQDMAQGYSFIDCPNMIPIVGQPYWISKRILKLDVKLKPDCFYQAFMNSYKYSGFKSENGFPMDDTYFFFHTKSNIDTTALNRFIYENFCNYFLQNYSYKDLHGINWKFKLDSVKETIIMSKSETEFGIKLLKVLRAANDPHLNFKINNNYYRSADKRTIPISYNLDAIFNQLTNRQQSINNVVFTGEISDVGYIHIGSLSSQYEQDISFAINQIRQMKDKPYLIFDLRTNGGGDDRLAKSVISILISDTIQYEKVVVLNELTGLFDKTIIRSVAPSDSSIFYNGEIYVITDGNIVSSAESFVLMFKQMSNAQTIGSTTYGSSGNPKEYNIFASVSINIPSWQAYDMEGTLIEGNGIIPDEPLEFTEDHFNTIDPIFEYIINKISSTGINNKLTNNSNNFFVYPNPVTAKVNITYFSQTNEKVQIQLIDIYGKTIFDQQVTSQQQGNSYIEIDLSRNQLRSGIYFIKLTKNNTMIVKKLIYNP